MPADAAYHREYRKRRAKCADGPGTFQDASIAKSKVCPDCKEWRMGFSFSPGAVRCKQCIYNGKRKASQAVAAVASLATAARDGAW